MMHPNAYSMQPGSFAAAIGSMGPPFRNNGIGAAGEVANRRGEDVSQTRARSAHRAIPPPRALYLGGRPGNQRNHADATTGRMWNPRMQVKRWTRCHVLRPPRLGPDPSLPDTTNLPGPAENVTQLSPSHGRPNHGNTWPGWPIMTDHTPAARASPPPPDEPLPGRRSTPRNERSTRPAGPRHGRRARPPQGDPAYPRRRWR